MIKQNPTNYEIKTWEQMYNPDFKVVEFDHFKMQAGLPSFVLSPGQWAEKTNAIGIYVKTALQWRIENPDVEGNIRDQATIEQLVVLSNLESINSVLIHQQLLQNERLFQINQIAINQMKSLLGHKSLKNLK